jgi:hypothetical protein
MAVALCAISPNYSPDFWLVVAFPHIQTDGTVALSILIFLLLYSTPQNDE